MTSKKNRKRGKIDKTHVRHALSPTGNVQSWTPRTGRQCRVQDNSCTISYSQNEDKQGPKHVVVPRSNVKSFDSSKAHGQYLSSFTDWNLREVSEVRQDSTFRQ
jgi:hypothetical protein